MGWNHGQSQNKARPHTLLNFLTVALGTLAQNKSLTLDQILDTRNLTESQELARSLTWYHMDEDDEQELRGDTCTQPEGKEDNLKAKCQELVSFMKARPGYLEYQRLQLLVPLAWSLVGPVNLLLLVRTH